MENNVVDTWQAMCHNAWQRHACVTHGMPCVNLHGSFKAYIRGCSWLIRTSKGATARRRRRKGKEEGRKGEEKGGKERRNGGKEKKKREEERGGREEKKKKRKRKECCAVSRPEHQRTQKCATRGRFPPTLVILCLGVV